MRSQGETYTLDEILALTNADLIKHWSKLATLIRAYEKNPDWEHAMYKALELRKDEKAANAYIDKVRKENPEPPLEIPAPDEDEPPKKQPKAVNPAYHRNFKSLLKLAPGIVEKLQSTDFDKGEFVYGVSKVLARPELKLQALQKIGNNYYVSLTQYVLHEGQMVNAPDMLLRLNPVKETLEAFEFHHYQQGSKAVWNDSYKPRRIDPKQEKAQNAFLSKWFAELKADKYKIKWKDPKPGGFIDSILIDEYKKVEREAAESKQAPAIPEPEQPAKAPKVSSSSATPYEIREYEKKSLIREIIRQKKASSPEEAEKEADYLIENHRVIIYLTKLIEETEIMQRLARVQKVSYWRLLAQVPQLFRWLESPDVEASISAPQKEDGPEYRLAVAKWWRSREIKQFAVYDQSADDGKGTLLIAIEPEARAAMITHLSGGFFGQEGHFDADTGNYGMSEVLRINEVLEKWLDALHQKQYVTRYGDDSWNQNETKIVQLVPQPDDRPASKPKNPKTEPAAEKEPVQKAPEEPQKEEEQQLFPAGKVQLTRYMIEHGVTQEIVDWINTNKRGLRIKARKGPMINNTKSIEMDKAIHALPAGKRISRFGGIYYEGRSNRADKGKRGL